VRIPISESTLDRHRKAGLIPDIPTGGRIVRIDGAVLDEFRRAGYPHAATVTDSGGAR
jgi:hypothetical protein